MSGRCPQKTCPARDAKVHARKAKCPCGHVREQEARREPAAAAAAPLPTSTTGRRRSAGSPASYAGPPEKQDAPARRGRRRAATPRSRRPRSAAGPRRRRRSAAGRRKNSHRRTPSPPERPRSQRNTHERRRPRAAVRHKRRRKRLPAARRRLLEEDVALSLRDDPTLASERGGAFGLPKEQTSGPSTTRQARAGPHVRRGLTALSTSRFPGVGGRRGCGRLWCCWCYTPAKGIPTALLRGAPCRSWSRIEPHYWKTGSM